MKADGMKGACTLKVTRQETWGMQRSLDYGLMQSPLYFQHFMGDDDDDELREGLNDLRQSLFYAVSQIIVYELETFATSGEL